MNIMQRVKTRREMPEGFQNMKASSRKKSKYSELDNLPLSYPNAAVLTALIKYQMIVDNVVPGAIAMDTNGRYLIEYYVRETSIECAVYNPANGLIIASLYDATKDEMKSAGEDNISLLILSLMEEILKDAEAREAYEEISYLLTNPADINDWQDFTDHVSIISDNVISRLKRKNQGFSIKNSFDKDTIGGIPLNSIQSNSFAVEAEIFGRVKVFKGKKILIYKDLKPNEFNGVYKFHTNEYVPELVAKINDSYYVPDTIIELCKLIKESTKIEPAFRNVLLYGDSGSGKTEGSYALAAGLGMPYVTYTCHPQTDNFDLIGQFVPVTDRNCGCMSIPDWLQENHLPQVSEVYENPKETYKKITGKKRVPATISTEDVVGLLFEKMFHIMGSNEQKNKEFVFVHSEIIEALKNGYLVEIQEPTVILNEGVLVGLNAILAGGYIRLTNGERIYRHPDSIVVFTTNSSEYGGYGKLSNSVLSRCSLVYEMKTPDIDEMVLRAVKKTKFQDRDLLYKMATCIEDVAVKVKESGNKDGVTGFRELISWISAYRILGNIGKAAIPTVINKATFDQELRGEIEDIIATELM